MIHITESDLKVIIKQNVIEELNKYHISDIWNRFEKSYITEGLTMSYSIGKIVNIIKSKYDLEYLGVKLDIWDDNKNSTNLTAPFKQTIKTVTETDNWYHFGLFFNFGIKDNVDIVKDIIHTCDALGWFLSDCTYYIRNGLVQNIEVKNSKTVNFNDQTKKHTPVKILFRAKFNAQYKPKSIPQFLYHICPLRLTNKILKQGLTPRNNCRIASHPQRVYLFLDYNNNWKNIADNFKLSAKNEPYAYLKIDTKKLNTNTKFYYDSNVMTDFPAIYTLEPIPPNSITIVDYEQNTNKK